MSHILEIESCAIWWPPGAVAVLFAGWETPRLLGPQTEAKDPPLLSARGALPAGSSPLGPGFCCPGPHNVPKFFGGMHIDTAKREFRQDLTI